MKKTDKEFPKPGRISNDGIQAVHIDSARQMVKMHTRGRLPPSQQNLNTDETSKVQLAPIRDISAPYPKVTVPAKSHEGECTNPQCAHCGSVIIPSPKATFPVEDKPSITIEDWSIFTIKMPILNSQEIDDINETRFEFPLPEMIFGNNKVRLVSDKSGKYIEFNAFDALESMDTSSMLKVSYHKEWLSSRRSTKSPIASDSSSSSSINNKNLSKLTEIVDGIKPYDWTYSPNYRGTTDMEFVATDRKIPIDRLLKPDPILFFDESVLFEDELGDNGISILSTKIRVMPSCLLLLCRFFLRIDNVIFRIRDVRVFVDFVSNDILREYKLQECSYDDLMTKSKSNSDPKKLFRDPNWVSQHVPVIECHVEVASDI